MPSRRGFLSMIRTPDRATTPRPSSRLSINSADRWSSSDNRSGRSQHRSSRPASRFRNSSYSRRWFLHQARAAGDWWTTVKHDEAIAPLIERLGPISAWGPEELTEAFVHDVPADPVSASKRLIRIPGPGMFREPWPLSARPHVPTRVLAPRDDRLFPLAFQRRVVRKRLGLPVEEMPGGHLPMLARPGELADRLTATSDTGARGSSPLSR